MSLINIDSSGFACDNMWDIQGAWYCYADTAGTSNCTGTGDIPFNATSNAMCISGTTSTSTSGATAFGAGLGLVLNQASHDAGKAAYTNPKSIVGFAITISGDSGGSALNINFPSTPALTPSGENPAVTVPAVSSATSPITYSVLFKDAIISDNTVSPVPTINTANLTDVQVAIPGADGIAHAYNYCITKIVPLMAAPTAPGTLATYGSTANEGKQIVFEGLGPYGIQNDPFGVGTDPMTMQVSYGNGQAGFTATPSFNTAGSNTPGAFPSIVYGWIHGGNFVGTSAGGYAGGKTVGQLTSVVSNWSFTAPGGGSWDAAYDTWFAQNQAPVNPGIELMVWLAHSTVNPIGGGSTAVTIGGKPFTFSTGTNGTGQAVVSYVSTTNMTSVTNFDLLPFFQDAAQNGRAGMSTGQFLLSVQAGFELYDPGTWTTTSYSVSAK